MIEYKWIGSQNEFIDEINITQTNNNMVLGRFGGNSSAGQYKNEDGCLIWANKENDWEFVTLLDSHNIAQSAELVVITLENEKKLINDFLKLDTYEAFIKVKNHILDVFRSKKFQEECEKVVGETACLIIIRKDNFLWWLSIGDCIVLLNHPELAVLGEFQQNHRSFYEWVGQESTFNKKVPCYSTGIKELRNGVNHIFLTTDGLTECPNADFNHPKAIFEVFEGESNKDGVKRLLEEIKNHKVRDSTTIISWKVINTNIATMPSNFRP